MGVAPLGQLACGVGARFAYDDALASFRVEAVPDGVHLAGAVNHRHGIAACLADGAAAAAAALGEAVGPVGEPECRSHPWPIFPHASGKDFVDFDEDQTVGDLLNAMADGFDDPELAKRYTTTAMGPSQGRHSALNALRIVRRASPLGPEAVGVTTTQRPPFLPESFGHLAGRGFEPARLTAMHHQHLALGARMMPAGLWYRPAYYGTPDHREAAIAAEVRAVREGVAMIDVSTLGGLEVRGPDAAELLERIYTFSYAKQPVGRTRYLLACDMTGAIIDDGVACRFADDWFYVTATTSGVDALYRSMLRWNAEWRLDVDVANVTAAYAGINVAGPLARQVLERLRRRHRPLGRGLPLPRLPPRHARRHPRPNAPRRLRGRARLRDPLPGLLRRGALGPAGGGREAARASAPSAWRRSASCGWRRATSSSARTRTA